MSTHTLPKEVVILDGRHFCCGLGHEKTHCLIGWASVQFLGLKDHEVTTVDYYDLPHCVKTALNAAITTVFGKPVDGTYLASSVYYVNDEGFDDYGNPTRGHRAKLARVWNLAMAKLGYTEGNPEAKRLKK